MLNIQSVSWPSPLHQVVGANPRALGSPSFHKLLEASVDALRAGKTQELQAPAGAINLTPPGVLEVANRAQVTFQTLTQVTERVAHTYQQIIDIRI